MELKIGKKICFSLKRPPIIIAEVSANHCGSLRKAFKIISSAKKNGADAIKIQTYNADSMTIKSKKGQFYIKKGLWKNKNKELISKIKKNNLSSEKIFEFCDFLK